MEDTNDMKVTSNLEQDSLDLGDATLKGNNEMATTNKTDKQNNTGKDKQNKQVSLKWNRSVESPNVNHAERHVYAKATRIKSRINRELGEIDDSQILNDRLRSKSGKVYSTSVSVEAGQNPTGESTSELVAAQEGSVDDLSADEMCGQDECCHGTSKILKVMAKLQESVDDVLKKVSRQEISTSNNRLKIEDLEEACDKNADEIDELTGELKETQFQLQVVTNIVIKQDQQIEFLKQRITDIQQREMSANIIVSGIPEKKQENPILVFNRFVAKGLEIQELIPANKAFRIGNGTNRPLLVELRDKDNKRKLFSNATKLKGKVNEFGKPYFLTEHLPEERNEDRRRMNELFAENRKKAKSHQLDMNFNRGKLVINEEPYRKAIQAPTAKEILQPDEALYQTAKELDIVKGKSRVADKSKFVSFAVAVQDANDVRAALLKLRIKYADATHVSCAYRIPGVNTPQNQDFVDDGEYGCGRTLLKVLKEQQFMNMAVFVVRYFGGLHLGSHRYNIFRELAEIAIKNLMSKRAEESSQGNPVSPLPDRFRTPVPPTESEEWHEIPEWNQNREKSD